VSSRFSLEICMFGYRVKCLNSEKGKSTKIVEELT